jgi:hypothetical protein
MVSWKSGTAAKVTGVAVAGATGRDWVGACRARCGMKPSVFTAPAWIVTETGMVKYIPPLGALAVVPSIRRVCVPATGIVTRKFPAASVMPRVVMVLPPSLRLTPARGLASSSRTWPMRTVAPGGSMARVAEAVRVTTPPSILVVPRISIGEDVGVLAEVVKVRSPAALGPRAGTEKVAVTPAGSGPVSRVVRPVKPPLATVLTLRLTVVPAMAVTVLGSTRELFRLRCLPYPQDSTSAKSLRREVTTH